MIHCAITTHTTPEPAVAYATINGVCRPRCQMHIARARRDGCTVRLRPLTPEPETVTVTRAAHLTDPPEPTMATAPAPHADRPFRSTPLDRNGITPNRRLPHVLRPHADDHPELCRVADCTGKVKARGACDQHLTMLGKADDTAVLLPRADRAAAAKRSAATRAAGKGEPVAVAPAVEQPAPTVGDEMVTLRATLSPGFWEWPESTRTAIWPSATGGFTARADDRDAVSASGFPTPEAAAAHLGARLPGEDVGVVLSPVAGEPGLFLWPDGRLAIGRTTGDGCIAWRKGEMVGKTYDHVTDALIAIGARLTRHPTAEEAAAHLGARLPDAPGAGGVAPVATDPTPRERELQAQVEAQAGQIRRLEQERDGWIDRTVEADKGQAKAAGMLADITLALDKSGKVNAPEMTGADRVRALVAYVRGVEEEGGYYGRLCSEAHDALDTAGIPPGGQPADRIRILAERRADPLTPQIRGIVAEILAGMERAIENNDPGRVQDVRALRIALGVEA